MTMRFGLDMIDTLPEPLRQIGHWRYQKQLQPAFARVSLTISFSPPLLGSLKALLAIFTAGEKNEEERYYSKGSPPLLCANPAQPIKARSLSLSLAMALRSVPDPTPHGGTPPLPPNWNGGGTNQLCQTISFCIHRVTDGNLKCFFLIVGRRDDILVSLSLVSYSRLEKSSFCWACEGEEADELL